MHLIVIGLILKSVYHRGSIMGPLLFNIYLNVFYFVDKPYTPNAVETTVDLLLQCLYKDTSALIKWSENNFLKMNPDKCKLLISKKSKDISIILGVR